MTWLQVIVLLMEFMIDNTIHNSCCVNKVSRKNVNDDFRDLLICFRYCEPRARRLLLLMLMVGASRGAE